MKKAWMLAFLLTIPLVVHAETQGQEGQKVNPNSIGTAGPPTGTMVCGYFNGDTTYRCLTLTTTNALITSEASKDRNTVFQQQVIGPQTTPFLVVGGSDSLAVPITAYPYRHWKLLIKCVSQTGTGQINRLAFQVRTHYNAGTDSSSTFAEYPFGDMSWFHTSPIVPRSSLGALSGPYNISQDSTRTQADTLNVGHLFTGSATAQWSGEFVVTINNNRGAPGSGVAANVFSYPNGISIPLDNIFGRDFWAPYLSVRVRNLAGPTCVVTCWLVGTPL